VSKLFVFKFTVAHTIELNAAQIWPDEPSRGKTAADARRVVESAGGPLAALRSWSLDRPTLSDGATNDDARVVEVRLSVTRRGRRRKER